MRYMFLVLIILFSPAKAFSEMTFYLYEKNAPRLDVRDLKRLRVFGSYTHDQLSDNLCISQAKKLGKPRFTYSPYSINHKGDTNLFEIADESEILWISNRYVNVCVHIEGNDYDYIGHGTLLRGNKSSIFMKLYRPKVVL